MRGLSIRLSWNGIGEAHPDPAWPKWFKKYHRCLFSPSRIVNEIVLSNPRRKVIVCQPMSGFSRYTRPTYGVRKTASVTPMGVRT